MKRRNRILKKNDFKNIIETGKKYYTQSFSFYFLNNTNDSFRIGVTVSKKVSKLAVARNKIKRQVNAIFTEHYNKDKLFDIVVIAKPDSIMHSYNQFKESIKSFIQHL